MALIASAGGLLFGESTAADPPGRSAAATKVLVQRADVAVLCCGKVTGQRVITRKGPVLPS